MNVRRVRPDDWPAVKELRLQALLDSPDVFGSTYAEEVDRPDDYWQQWSSEAAGQHDKYIAVAEADLRLVGMAGATRRRQRHHAAFLFSMWVDPAYRRQGVGRRLVEAVIDWANDEGFSAVELKVAHSAINARRLYEGAGFSAVRDDPLRRDSDLAATVMERPL